MNKFKFIIYSIVTLLFFTYADINAQRDPFSEEVKKYPKEIYDKMDYNLSDKDEEMLEVFTELWNESGAFSEDEKMEIIKLSNHMLENRARPYPHFKYLVKTLVLFKKERIQEQNYESWKKGIQKLLDDRIRMTTLEDYFERTYILFKNNVLYQSYSSKWEADKGHYDLKTGEEISVEFDIITLTCYSKRDSIKVYDTKGTYILLDGIWKGKGGIVTWERADYKKNKVYATLKNYTINMKKYKYKADSVEYFNNEFIGKPLLGKLSDKVMNTSIKSNILYPQFETYTKNFKIKDLYKNINYEGGFMFEGARIIGKGTKNNKARLDITRSDTTFFRAASNYIVINKEQLKALETEVTIYTGHDSIYHPSSTFTYIPYRRMIVITKGENITSQIPYLNSYHKVNMDFEELRWKIDEPFIYMTMKQGNAFGIASFKSFNYFNKAEYEKMLYLDPIHPLVAVKQYAKSYGFDEFDAMGFAKYMGFSIHHARRYLMKLAAQGFIYFDTETDMVRIKQLLYDYVDASAGRVDYDVINFVSETKAPTENAVLDIRNMDLIINGMPRVLVSNAQNVDIITANKKITLKRNRSFSFKGQVNAGKLTFYGDNFFFKYDSFKINLQNVDSLEMRIADDVNQLGRPVFLKVKNVIENITGDLFIDKPNNKSGLEDHPRYPVFASREFSYVYYDDPGIFNGVYPKEEFYFKLDSFVFDSLDNFNKFSLKFPGEFESAGIFPTSREELRLMEDRSLGLRKSVPGEGTPIYNGKGIFYKNFKLNFSGLRGEGRIEYLSSTIHSDDFIFLPDSMNTEAYKFTVDKDKSLKCPPALSSTTKIHWEPYNDELTAENIEEEFELYNGKAVLNGSISLKPSGLFGNGVLDMKTAVMESNNYVFKEKSFDADSADFKLRSLSSSNFTLKTENVDAHIDFYHRKGTFKSNEDYSLVQFPTNKYISYLDYFVWHMDTKEFDLGLTKTYKDDKLASFKGDTLAGPRYISVHPDQDSLNFVSNEATYDYKDNLLKAKQVDYIKVADAKIFPNEENVTIESNAKMRTLEKADILASDSTRYHSFYDATVNINSRKYYKAEGDFDYHDKYGTKQKIHFQTISVDTGSRTYAQTTLIENDSFMLSPKFQYLGDILLRAEEKLLYFDGGVNIKADCETHGSKNTWISFESTIDPEHILIPIPEQPTNINNKSIYSGTIISHDSIHVYSSFLAGRKSYSDSYITRARGFLHYNEMEDWFEISREEKLYNPDLPGNYLRLAQYPCEVYGEGEIDLGLDLWQVGLEAVGEVTHKLDTNTVEMNLMMGIDFFMHKNVIKTIVHHIDSISNIMDIERYSEKYMARIDELLYQNDFKDMRAEDLYEDTIINFPKELQSTLLFDALTLKWDQKTKSYYSEGRMNLVSVGNYPVNIEVQGYMEFRRHRDGDRWDLFLKIDKDNWYYFGYNRAILQTWSSYEPYAMTIDAYKVNKRTISSQSFWDRLTSIFSGKKDTRQSEPMTRTKARKKPYRYMVSTAEKMFFFLQRYQDRTGKRLLYQ